MTVDEMVARLQAMFDISSATALAYINERHRRMVTEAMWRAATSDISTTTAGQANYDLPANVVDVKRVRIDHPTNGVRIYDPVGIEALWDIDRGQGTLVGQGVFAEDWTSSGTAQIRLYPVPDTTGLAIKGLVALLPGDLAAGAGQSPIVPAEFHPAILDGTIADGYREQESNPQLAERHEQLFIEGVEKLRRRKNTRVGGASRMQLYRADYTR